MTKQKQYYEITAVFSGKRKIIVCKTLNAFLVMTKQLTVDGIAYGWDLKPA